LFFVEEHIHIPNANNQISEVTVPFNLGVNDSVVLNEASLIDSSLVFEVAVGAMQSGEHIHEIESGLFQALLLGEHVWMSLGVKLGFNFF
jgi:hypothetical protein